MTPLSIVPAAINEERPPEVPACAPVAACQHCSRLKVNRPRGLCWTCYYTPGVRERYGPANPRFARWARRGIAGANRNYPLPAVPTTAAPGTPEKLAVLLGRARHGQQLFHPADARYEGDMRPGVFLEARAAAS